MTREDRARLGAVARHWQIKPSEVVRIAIRALAEAVDAIDAATAAPMPAPPDGAAAPGGQGVGDDH